MTVAGSAVPWYARVGTLTNAGSDGSAMGIGTVRAGCGALCTGETDEGIGGASGCIGLTWASAPTGNKAHRPIAIILGETPEIMVATSAPLAAAHLPPRCPVSAAAAED